MTGERARVTAPGLWGEGNVSITGREGTVMSPLGTEYVNIHLDGDEEGYAYTVAAEHVEILDEPEIDIDPELQAAEYEEDSESSTGKAPIRRAADIAAELHKQPLTDQEALQLATVYALIGIEQQLARINNQGEI